jgi:hypothetical protein
MINLQGQPGELRFTLQITRKDTGQVEEVELVGRITSEDLTHGSDPLERSTERSD